MPTRIFLTLEIQNEDADFVDIDAAIAAEILHVRQYLFRGVGLVTRVMNATIRNGVEVKEEKPDGGG